MALVLARFAQAVGLTIGVAFALSLSSDIPWWVGMLAASCVLFGASLEAYWFKYGP